VAIFLVEECEISIGVTYDSVQSLNDT